jgi:hypothetical protein
MLFSVTEYKSSFQKNPRTIAEYQNCSSSAIAMPHAKVNIEEIVANHRRAFFQIFNPAPFETYDRYPVLSDITRNPLT